jgi:uncharacterized membrane protein YphA (DoxX/SURF4 family)
MSISSKLDQLHFKARSNKWLGYFAIFNRIALAAGFLPSGMTKILGERFTVLAVNHPMGNYLEAIFHTGYYYTLIGVLQVLAAILLLIPRTATLGAIIYFPIILNICVLSLAVRFDGSLISSPLMVLSCLYLLCWDYHKLKFILPFNHSVTKTALPEKKELSNKFPIYFFAGVVGTVAIVVVTLTNVYTILPRNTIKECTKQCKDKDNPKSCLNFCDCIHTEGKPLNKCLKLNGFD